jgi:uncharacterized SAM-binding protein YcdF (DUF218 family)
MDAQAPGLGPADLVFVFGTRLARPAELAADLFVDGLAPLVVVTGGSERQADGRNEAEHHREVLLARGVPEAAVIVENRSTNTPENVLFALPLIEARCAEPPVTVIAVVKRFHRRALITLARFVPSVERIYAVVYEPDVAIAPPSSDRTERELAHLESLAAECVDLLVADGNGWCRTSAAASPPDPH